MNSGLPMTEEIKKAGYYNKKAGYHKDYDEVILHITEQSEETQRLCKNSPRTVNLLAEDFRIFEDFLRNAQEACMEDSPLKEVAYLDEAFRKFLQLWTKIENVGVIGEVREKLEVIGDNISALKERDDLLNRKEVLDDMLEDGIMSAPPEHRREMRKSGVMIRLAKEAAEEDRKKGRH